MRHPAPRVEPGVCYGQLDLELIPGFETQVIETKRTLPANAAVYTSPLQRCHIPARILSDNPIVDPRIQEYNFGVWEGKNWHDLSDPLAKEWMKDYLHTRAPGGETFQELRDRVLDFIAEIRGMDSAILVTHAGVIRAAMIDLQDIKPSLAFRRNIAFGSITRIQM